MRIRTGSSPMQRYPLLPLIPLTLIGGALTLAFLSYRRSLRLERELNGGQMSGGMERGGPTARRRTPNTRDLRRDIVDQTTGNPNYHNPDFSPISQNDGPVNLHAAAAKEGLTLTEDHIEAIRVLQNCYVHDRDVAPSLHDLKEALEEKFKHKGGHQYLYRLFPGGPVAQGCRIAGLKAPITAMDKGFGSVA